MVLNASTAHTMTVDAIAAKDAATLQQEVTNCESVIRTAATKGFYSTLFNAEVIGNPKGNPILDANLPSALQRQFRDLFMEAGYTVELDSLSGRWKLTWEAVG